jgi:CRISPR system Cascade subunit CasA
MTMNLTIDPWIPALRADGRRDLFSLQDLFAHAHELRDLAVKPHERIALMRLLLCITQAALDGPADEDAWEQCEPLIQPRVRAYLDKWQGSFELFGDGRRFLQLPNLQPGKESDEGNAATKLDLTLATGNTSTLFDNHAGGVRSLQSARSAINLVTFQCFSPGARIGVALWNGIETVGKGSSKHAPCNPSSMVHTLLLGETLLHTIHLNLLSRETVTDSFGPNRWGQPEWELPVEKTEDKAAIENAALNYLGRLVPLSRAIRLDDSGATIILANGLDYPIYPAFRETTATIIKRKDKEELAVLPSSTNRSLWRQLAAVSIRRRSAADVTCGPLALAHASSSGNTVLWVGALVTDKAKIEDVIESSYSLPPGMFTEFGRAAYEKGVAHAEEREGFLIQAVKTYASSLKVAAPAYDRARQSFWTRVEQHLSNLFDLARNIDLVADLPNCAWGQAVQNAAKDAYNQSCPRQTPRQIEAYALGLRRLNFRPKVNQTTTNTAHE